MLIPIRSFNDAKTRLAGVLTEADRRRLAQAMAEPLAMDQLIALAAARGLAVTEADVLAAQERADAAMAPQQLQERVAQEARRLRHFIQG